MGQQCFQIDCPVHHLYTQMCFVLGFGPNVQISIRSVGSSGLSGASSNLCLVLLLSLMVFFTQS